MNQDIYVLIEHLRGQVSDISYIMLAAARVLSQETGGNVVAMLLGHNAQDLAGDMNAERVIYIDHPRLAEFTSEAYKISLGGSRDIRPVGTGPDAIDLLAVRGRPRPFDVRSRATHTSRGVGGFHSMTR